MEKTILSKVITGSLPYENITEGCVVFIGDAPKGPVEIPVSGEDIEVAKSIFGEDSELVNALIEFRAISDKDVFLVKMNGSPSMALLTDIISTPRLKLMSLDASESTRAKRADIYTVTDLETEEEALYLEIKDFIKGTRHKYNITGKTIQEIENAINREAYIGLVDIFAETILDGDSSDLIAQVQPFEGGSSEKDTYHQRWPNILQSLYGLKVSQIGILGIDFASNTPSHGWPMNYLSLLADRWASDGEPCMFTVGLSKAYSKEAAVEKLRDFATNEVPSLRISEYVNFAVGRFRVGGTYVGIDAYGEPYTYVSNTVPSYCALISKLGIEETTTYKVVPNVLEDLLKLSDPEIKELSSFGYAVMHSGPRNPTRVYEGVNLLRGTGGITMDESFKATIQKSKPLASLGNALFVMKFISEMHTSLSSEIGSTATTQDDIALKIASIVKRYPKIIRESVLTVTESTNGYAKEFAADLHLWIYGEIESIEVSVSTW